MSRFWFPAVILLNNTALLPLNLFFQQRLFSFFIHSTVTTWKKQLLCVRVSSNAMFACVSAVHRAVHCTVALRRFLQT